MLHIVKCCYSELSNIQLQLTSFNSGDIPNPALQRQNNQMYSKQEKAINNRVNENLWRQKVWIESHFWVVLENISTCQSYCLLKQGWVHPSKYSSVQSAKAGEPSLYLCMCCFCYQNSWWNSFIYSYVSYLCHAMWIVMIFTVFWFV